MATGALGPDSPSKRKKESGGRQKKGGREDEKTRPRTQKKRPGRRTKNAQKARGKGEAHHAPVGASQIADNENL